MATAQNVTVDTETDEVHIESLTIQDQDLTSFLSEAPEGPEAATEQALRVGASTLGLANTTREVEFVRREFEALQTTFAGEIDTIEKELDRVFAEEGTLEMKLDSAFGKEGKLSQRLDDEFGKDGNVIQHALDPNIEGTPTHALRMLIQEEIRTLRERLDRDAGRAEVRQKSHWSGYDFEDTLEDLLSEATYNTTDDVVKTAETEGELPGRIVGDFVYTVGETGQRIVIEAKDSKCESRPELEREMTEAIENRDADYGVFVSACESHLPNAIGYFQPFDNFVCVSLSATPDDELDPGFLRVALSWARTQAIQHHGDTASELDPEEVRTRVESVRSKMGRVATVKRKCTTMQKTAGEVKGLLDELRDEVLADLDAINGELSKATDRD